MTIFILAALALTATAVAVVVVPLLRKSAEAPRSRGAALIAGTIISVGAAGLYIYLSDWSWKEPAPATTPQTMVAKLARRLEKQPDDLQGWLMLGRSYMVLGQLPLAVRAYQRADRLADGKSVDALVGLGEALASQDEAQLDGRAGRLFEQAIALDPRSGKALFYGAATALRRGDLGLARERLSGLLALNPPEDIRPLLQSQIDAIDRQIAGKAISP